jgi:exodeoxyribonuclease-3
VLRVVSANVNGIRAAARRGGLDRLGAQQPDVLCLQEVRADGAQLAELLDSSAFAGWHVAHAACSVAGRCGVAVVTRERPLATRAGLGRREFDACGRWVETDLATAGGVLTLASVYVPTGEAGTPRQDLKYRFLDAMGRRMGGLRRAGGHAVVMGDLNVAHREADLRNWRGNLRKAGFLADERAYLDRWTSSRGGWVDVHRSLAGEGPGPYTWWSWRGHAFDDDSGWRIDYQLATAALASRAVKAEAGRAPTYAERWSDHAAVTVDYDL